MRRLGLFVTAVLVCAVAMTAPAGATPQPSAATPRLVSSGAAWGTPRAPGGVHPDSWYGSICEGQFVSVSVSGGKFPWGGVQSCTSPKPQTLEFLLLNKYGDVVGAPYISWVGYQNYIHRSTTCSSTALSTWKEYAYGTADGQQLQPYPALKPFKINCYHAGTGGCRQMQIKADLIHEGLDLIAHEIRDVKPNC